MSAATVARDRADYKAFLSEYGLTSAQRLYPGMNP